MSEAKKKKRYSCSECGGTNLLWQAWVNEFDEVFDDSSDDVWCDDCCSSYVQIEDNEDDKTKQSR